MTEPVIAKKSPYVVELQPGTYFWCACGRSKNQPFCDGSHKGTSFTPQAFVVEEKVVLALCGCKHTQDKPFCDGTHSDL